MYVLSVYKTELAVASQSVSVSAGGVTTSNIASTEAVRHSVFVLEKRIIFNHQRTEPNRDLANW